jgi:response regulator RpfG family c-di-GMP phosphodiesterase
MSDSDSPEARIARYRETAAALRRQAEEVRYDPEVIDQLLALADEWLKLAAGVEKEWLP